MFKRYLSGCLLSLILLQCIAGSLTYASETTRVAFIKSTRGEVVIKKSGGEKSIKAFVGMGLVQGDTIITGKDGSVTVGVEDEYEFMLSKNTEILVSKLLKSNSTDSITKIKLKSGGIWSRIKKALSPKSQYEIKTPTVVLGARGTDFYVHVYGNTVTVYVFQGEIYATYLKTIKDETEGVSKIETTVIIKAGQMLSVKGTAREVDTFKVEPIEIQKLDLFSLVTLKRIKMEDIQFYPSLNLDLIEKWIKIKQTEEENNPISTSALNTEDDAAIVEFYKEPIPEEEPIIREPIEEVVPPDEPPQDNLPPIRDPGTQP